MSLLLHGAEGGSWHGDFQWGGAEGIPTSEKEGWLEAIPVSSIPMMMPSPWLEWCQRPVFERSPRKVGVRVVVSL
ncbi:hypothetical protein IEQ34_015170 [Dendrobium chrysotoxum]|uniref:Uncharacterized protein n=1 Tax=Dendrobium chrysotoxum TaxID=161865 RepID=A0AAV7GP04_DENCH|nr:hypothetical protein IEQ34_015170 [Dendrobium chrysotoxum]